ncbi:non-ribosomal peptide synthetase [Actinomarinicola tropica]|uniref:non-ribosomal peptide synthetase n=1 Tax=Actinomarinicola tropica TaxID=2789776 RepID=UPI001E3B5CD6|nr:non-ribosomal peptide synthetase [Actinomarinicola tropica]
MRVPPSWTTGPRRAPALTSMADLLDHGTSTAPDAPALIGPGPGGIRLEITYAELDRAVRARVAGLVAELDDARRVAVVAARHVDLVVTVLALWRAGISYVPVDPRSPDERWAAVLDIAEVTHVVGAASLLADRDLPPAVRTVPWDADAEPQDRPSSVDGSAEAYVLFTSGTTGRPKGVVVSHANLAVRLDHLVGLHPTPPRSLLQTTLAFDAALAPLLATLATGGAVVLADDEHAADPALAAQLIADEQVTYVDGVPSWYAALLDLAPPGALDSIRIVVVGAEVLPPELVTRHHRRLHARLVNDYGPTEATISATSWEVPVGWSGARVPIGRPHANTVVHVVAPDGTACGPGETGELWILGDGVAQGYLGRPDDPAFAPDPVTGAPCYRTGDLVSWRDDGLLDLHGRADRQVKIRGQRVEPDETEMVLLGPAFDDLANAAVEVDRSTGSPRLVAYVAPRPGASPTREDVAARLARILPPAQQPEVVVVLDALPTTPGGKIDRTALAPPPAGAAADGGEGHDDLERSILRAAEEVLAVEPIGRDADLAAIGADSLAAARIAARLRRRDGVDVEPSDLRDAPTAAALATLLRARPPRPLDDDVPHHVERDPSRVHVAPATDAHTSFWLLEQEPSRAGRSNISAVRHVVGVDVDEVQRAVDVLVERHAGLRTSFELRAEGVVQLVHPAGTVALTVERLDALGASHIDHAAARPFALDVAPLWRVLVAPTPGGVDVGVVVHHAIADGWALETLVDELVALAAHPGTPLPDAELDAVDLQRWVAERVERHGEDALAHWRRRVRLADETKGLVLPYDHRPRAGHPLDTDEVRLELDADARRRLTDAAARGGTSLFGLLVTGLAVTLRRYGAPERFTLGAAMANRPLPELEALIATTANFVPLEVGLDESRTIGHLLTSVDGEIRAAERWSWFPSELALRAEPRARSGHLVDVMVSMLNYRVASDVRRTPPSRMALTDLSVEIAPTDHGMSISLVHHEHRLDRPTVEALADAWRHTLELLAGDPATPLASLLGPRLVDEQEATWLGGEEGPAPRGTIMDLVLPHLEAGGAHAAVITGEREVSWSDLGHLVPRLASALAERGAGPGDRIVMALDGVEGVEILLACWWLGAVPVPQGERQPATKLAEIAERTEARLVLHPADVAALVDDAAGRAPLGRRDLDGSDPAYILFTSGSTGRPKGVVISHRALRASTDARLAWYDETPGTCLQLHDMAFDAAMATVTWYLAVGGTLVTVHHEDRLDLPLLADLIDRHSIGKIALVPSHHRALLQSVEPGRLPSLRLVAMGGEAVAPSLVELHRSRVPGARLVNEYGPTECTVWTVAHECTAEDEQREVVPIGRPIPGTVVRVADPRGRPVPRGAIGELLLGGHLLGEGYLDEPEQTAQRFVVHDGRRWYQTGDRVRWSTDGELEFHGRVDDQLKLRGYRIEPGEVEQVLVEDESVVRAKVGAVELAAGAPVLAAWVQPAGGATVSATDLLAACRTRLPEWMVPAHLVVVDEMPLTTSGKVDRRRLPRPQIDVGAEAEQPATPTEERVQEVWADLLGHRVGVTDDFFSAGGHSLLAAQMAVRVREATGSAIGLRDVLDAPTIRRIATLVDQLDGAGTVAERERAAGSVAARGDRDRTTWPLAPHQARLWYLTQLESTADAYHMVRIARVHGGLDVEALDAATRELGRRHPWLRSTIAVINGAPVQRVHDDPLVGLLVAPDGCDATAWSRELAARTFDLGSEAPWRIGVAPSGDHHVLTTVVHHVISDATADATFVEDLGRLYARAAGRETAEVPEAAHPGPIAADLAAARSEARRAADVAAWTTSLSGIDLSARLPVADDATPGVRRSVEAERTLDAELAARLVAVADQHSVTPFSLAAAAVGVVSARRMGVHDLVVGAPVDLRWRYPDAARTVAFMVETGMLPVRDPVGRSLVDTAADVLGHVADLLDSALPLDAVVAELRRHGELPTHGDPLQTYVGWIEADSMVVPHLGPGGPALEVLQDEPLAPMFDVNWTFVRREDGIVVRLDLDWSRLGERTAERLLDEVEHVLTVALDAPTQAVADLPALPAHLLAEVVAFGGQLPEQPLRPLVTSLWDALATSGAAVSALSADGSWRVVAGPELAERADDVAAALVASGIAPGSCVAVSSERGIPMVTAVLGVLRAGCAFVPIDAGHPVQRQRLLADEVDARAVIGTRPWIDDLAAHRGVTSILLDDDGRPTSRAPAPAAWPDRPPGSTTYVLFTSGSTGTPKGVVVTDEALRRRIDSFREAYGVASRFLHQSALGFDASIFMFWVLDTGGTLVVAPDEAAADPGGLGAVITDGEVDTMFVVPTVHRLLLEVVPGAVAGMRTVLIGGEELTPSLVAQHAAAAPDTALVNVYGPTETVVTATSAPIDPGVHAGGSVAIPIGRPHPGTLARIVDRHGGPTGVGAAGELLLGGPCVAAGYHGRPDLTAAAFVEPSDDRDVRWYRTGDQVRWTEDGDIVFLGRLDRQVKLRGQRIELSEIEHAVLALDGVEDALVDVVGSGSTARLVALVSPVSGRSSGEARAELARTLPRAWVPSQVVEVAAIPRTLGDKLDRRALPELVGDARPDDDAPPPDDVAAPVHAAISSIASAMAELLDRSHVGPDDDFFDVGGHSLLAAQLINVLAERLDATVTLADLMDAATPRRLTEVIERRAARSWTEERPDAEIHVLRDGELAPLAIVARDGETSFYLRHVLKVLDPRRPLWLVLRPAPTISERAFDLVHHGDRVAAALRTAGAPAVHLLGHSASGVVALEAAERLGAQAATVTLLDTVRPNGPDDVVREPVRRVRAWLADPRGEWRSLVALRRAERTLRRPTAEPDPMAVRQVRDAQDMRGFGRYRGRRFTRSVTLLAAEQTADGWGHDLGWSRWCDDLEVLPLPGDHFGVLMPPHVDATIAALAQILDDRP